MKEKSSSDNIIKEKTQIDSITGLIKTKESESRKTEKLKFTNRLATYILGGYFILFILYIFMPFFTGSESPSSLLLFEKLGTTLIAVVIGFYFGQNDFS